MIDYAIGAVIGGGITITARIMMSAFNWKGRITTLESDKEHVSKKVDAILKKLDGADGKYVLVTVCDERSGAILQRLGNIEDMLGKIYKSNGFGTPPNEREGKGL